MTGWEVYPQGLREILSWVKQRDGDVPLYVTENGAAFPDPAQAPVRIVHVDFASQRRIPKTSARFYSNVIASNGGGLGYGRSSGPSFTGQPLLGRMPRCVTLLIYESVEAAAWRGEARSDVRKLLRQLPGARLEYREVRDVERRERSAAALGFDGVPAFGRAPRPRTWLPVVGAMRILFVSSSPGVGATTIAAAMAQLLAQTGDACGAVDLGSSRELGRRLGAPAVVACSDGCAGLHLSTDANGVQYAGAGCHRRGSAAALDRVAEVLPGCSTIVVDVSTEMASAAASGLAADAIVAVLHPSAALRESVSRALAWEARAPLHLLLNAYDGRRASDRAARAALEARLGPAFLPFVIHEDAALGELPPGASLAERSPESQVLRDLAELMNWLRGSGG